MRSVKGKYANSINLSGLYSKTPVFVRKEEGFSELWDRTGNYSAPDKTEGVWGTPSGIIGYVSVDRTKVRAWTDGALAAFAAMKRLAGD